MTRNEVENLVKYGKWIFPGEAHKRLLVKRAREERNWRREERTQRALLWIAIVVDFGAIIEFLLCR